MNHSVSLLRTLVGFDTTSHRSNLDFVDWAVATIEPFGARIRLSHDDTGTKANLLASFGPVGPGGIVLSGHSDVVPVEGQRWSSDPFVLTERDGRLHGRGTTDMKAFVACCLAAMPAIAAAALQRPIHIALSYDEEVGCFGVPRLIADLLAHEPRPALAIIGEPTRMRLGDRHRGFLGFRTSFTGKPAHSSDPSAGASAIYPASAFVSFLKALGDEASSGIDATTFNVGRIDGGTAINIVPGACDVVWEFRPFPGADVAAIRDTIDTFLARATPSDIAHATELLTRVPPLAPQPDGMAADLAGLLAGYLGGRVDSIIMRIADVQLTFPAILIALLIDGVVRGIFKGVSREDTAIYVLVISIGLSFWVQYARTIRGSTLVERSKDYVYAARLVGLPAPLIMLRHVLPNVIGPVLVILTINLGLAVITEATLSFLGVGLPATQPSLGTLISTGNKYLFSGDWWIVTFPSITLAALVLAINLLGDWLRDALNPKLR